VRKKVGLLALPLLFGTFFPSPVYFSFVLDSRV